MEVACGAILNLLVLCKGPRVPQVLMGPQRTTGSQSGDLLRERGCHLIQGLNGCHGHTSKCLQHHQEPRSGPVLHGGAGDLTDFPGS